ncbi:hypothetical protein Anas_03806 [Armadillidium nasatum]|uniref:C2 domain-containing protein n=1 Tax=Armadillidium nasatum TaxID=96803 RepID=A0A5N5SHI5_9CRUS|nr:hypothetical protein Anas_03806 [Armadillidium nasatum]
MANVFRTNKTSNPASTVVRDGKDIAILYDTSSHPGGDMKSLILLRIKLPLPLNKINIFIFIRELIFRHDENGFDDTVLGRLWFTVVYDDEKSDLRVNIMHARYPNGRGVGSNTGEVWIEGIILSPMNTVKGTSRTSTRRATYSPVFNHSFLYLISKDEVKTCILKLTLHDRHPKKGERQKRAFDC